MPFRSDGTGEQAARHYKPSLVNVSLSILRVLYGYVSCSYRIFFNLIKRFLSCSLSPCVPSALSD